MVLLRRVLVQRRVRMCVVVVVAVAVAVVVRMARVRVQLSPRREDVALRCRRRARWRSCQARKHAGHLVQLLVYPRHVPFELLDTSVRQQHAFADDNRCRLNSPVSGSHLENTQSDVEELTA